MCLGELRMNDVSEFRWKGNEINAKVVSVLSGNTFRAIVEKPFPIMVKCIMKNVRVPTIQEDKQRAIMARNRLCELLTGEMWSPICDKHKKIIQIHCYGWETMKIDGYAEPDDIMIYFPA